VQLEITNDDGTFVRIVTSEEGVKLDKHQRETIKNFLDAAGWICDQEKKNKIEHEIDDKNTARNISKRIFSQDGR
jgi:hypothetical protein